MNIESILIEAYILETYFLSFVERDRMLHSWMYLYIFIIFQPLYNVSIYVVNVNYITANMNKK